jgi:biotin carboxyl carrier protein
MLKSIVSGGQTYEIVENKDGIEVNGNPFQWSSLKVKKGKFQILYKERSFTAQVIDANYEEKSFTIKVNRNQYQIAVKDRFDILLDQLGMGGLTVAKLNNIKAPMPGLIIEFKVEVGDVVKKGDTVIILEAMKMENIIKSPGDGIVKAIKVAKRDNVEKNQVLIEFE